MANSYANKRRPKKTHPELPVFAHNNGQRCRKIAGKLYSLGSSDDPIVALKEHNRLDAPMKHGVQGNDSVVDQHRDEQRRRWKPDGTVYRFENGVVGLPQALDQNRTSCQALAGNRQGDQGLSEGLAATVERVFRFPVLLVITAARRKWAHTSLPSEVWKLRTGLNTDDDGEGLEPEPILHVLLFPSHIRDDRRQNAGSGRQDQVAINAVMGHVDSSMAAEYREEIESKRLEAVADHVQNWLFGGLK